VKREERRGETDRLMNNILIGGTDTHTHTHTHTNTTSGLDRGRDWETVLILERDTHSQGDEQTGIERETEGVTHTHTYTKETHTKANRRRKRVGKRA
jgi:hypothetical protein